MHATSASAGWWSTSGPHHPSPQVCLLASSRPFPLPPPPPPTTPVPGWWRLSAATALSSTGAGVPCDSWYRRGRHPERGESGALEAHIRAVASLPPSLCQVHTQKCVASPALRKGVWFHPLLSQSCLLTHWDNQREEGWECTHTSLNTAPPTSPPVSHSGALKTEEHPKAEYWPRSPQLTFPSLSPQEITHWITQFNKDPTKPPPQASGNPPPTACGWHRPKL